MSKKSFFLILFLLPFYGMAQNYSISGKVFDVDSGLPIRECHVFIPGSGYQAFSDSLGDFKITGVPPGGWQIIAAKEGYQLGEFNTEINSKKGDENYLELPIIEYESPDQFQDFLSSKTNKLLEQFEIMLREGIKNPKDIVLLNPEVLSFYSQNDLTWVYTRDVLLVQNLESSYLISVWLKAPLDMSRGMDENKIALTYLELEAKSLETKRKHQEKRLEIYKSSPTYAIRDLVGKTNDRTKPAPTSQEGEFLFRFQERPYEIYSSEKRTLDYEGEEILIRSNGVPVDPTKLKATGFPGKENPLLELPLEFDFKRAMAVKELENTPEALQERVFLHTDRDVYLMGENMFFKAYVLYGDPVLMDESSKILHVEVLDTTGYSILHHIFPIENGLAKGQVPLTPELSGTNFIVKAYTLWGANYGPEFEFYKPFQVRTSDWITDKSGISSFSKGVTLFTDQELYQEEDSVTVNIMVSDQQGMITQANLSVSVVKAESFLSIDEDKNSLVSYTDLKPKIKEQFSPSMEKEFAFTLVGKISDSTAAIAKSKVEVLVDGFIDKRELNPDHLGRFHIEGLNKMGDFSLAVKASNHQGIPLRQFRVGIKGSSNRPDLSGFQYPKLDTVAYTNSRIDSLRRAHLALREGEILLEEVEVEDKKEVSIGPMPYGSPQYSIEMEDVFLTGDTDQFIHAFTKKVPGLSVEGNPPRLLVRGGLPLILLNGVPITTPKGATFSSEANNQYSSLRMINVFAISRIEVIKSIVPVYGDLGRNGVISIFLKTGEEYLRSLSNTGDSFQEFKLQGLQDSKPIANPIYPFSSSTWYWNPEVIITAKQTAAKIKFKLPEEPGAFWVLVNGINASGEAVSGRFLLNQPTIASEER
ncbi:carboxypeptidase regulatory-like domain-containing protein [Algoriphagus litoralis]|uniref:carboxypeptidase regulatory-like domain-containing protein n=1 Tax=Algoriphagus litoralis TaxID=2202829 RepID=UPI000DBAA83C|nr:carboxypeptidase regulatory-like domain-containing protein [Algoriphagus litoralis]